MKAFALRLLYCGIPVKAFVLRHTREEAFALRLLQKGREQIHRSDLYQEVDDMQFIYPAVFSKREDGVYHFPDLDQCYAEGDTLDEVLYNAIEEARSWIR